LFLGQYALSWFGLLRIPCRALLSFSEDSGALEVAHAIYEELLGHLPFGTKHAYVREIMAADLDKLANIIGICGV